MKVSLLSFFLKKEILQIFTLAIVVAGPALSQSQFRVLYDFNGPDGSWPQSLMFDSSGNLYGTTAFGGNSNRDCNSMGCGTVFELVRNADGSFSETVLYAFCSVGSNCSDGYNPNTALVFDAAGNLFGTTESGGANGGGEVYELTPTGQGGAWSLSVLYSFCASSPCADGEGPSGAMAVDASGNLYGATDSGGSGFHGTVFELSPPLQQGGPWTESVLYDFCSDMNGQQCLDGYQPIGGVTLNSLGNLYGTTGTGGRYSRACGEGCGTVYELSPSPTGWNFSTYAPAPTVGAVPSGPLVSTPSGTVFGTFGEGGASGAGSVFRVSPTGQRTSFSLLSEDGSGPFGLALGNGVLFGSARGVGSNVPGTIFQITPSGQESVLHTFCSRKGCPDGDSPLGLITNGSGTLFGAAAGGGTSGHGVIFAITP